MDRWPWRWLDRKSQVLVVALALLLVGVVGYLDHLTGFEISFSIFYLVPVVLIAWFRGRNWTTGVALLSAVVWFVVDVTSGHVYSREFIHVWNAGVRLGFFLITGHLIATLRVNMTRLHELARLDPLTGVLNGRAFTVEGERLLALGRRRGEAFSLAYIDVDDFKRVNDAGGHRAGDALLRALSQTLVSGVRTVDLVARLGGDEFALLLPGAGGDEARLVVSRILEALAARFGSAAERVSVSVGISTFISAPENLDVAVTAADQLMYRVKAQGKGTLCQGIWRDGALVTDLSCEGGGPSGSAAHAGAAATCL